MFVDFFIKRPVMATVCSLILILGGAVAIPTLPISQYPQLAPPQVQVTSFYVGASSAVVESAVTTPLEQGINGVEGMKYIQSVSGNDGTSTITVTFDVERDIDLAAVDVQNRVSQVLGRLPNEVKTTGVTVTKASTSMVFAAAFYCEHGEYSQQFISNYVDVYVKDAVKRVKGTGTVTIFGERKYSMRLWLDPWRLAARKLTAADVVAALSEQNVQIAAGQIGQEPALPGQRVQISVRAVGRLPDVAAFERMILKTGADGTLVLLKDVGRAELGSENYSSQLRYSGRDAIGLGIFQLPSANALDVEKQARTVLEHVSRRFPPGLKYRVAFDPTTSVRGSIKEVLETLGEAIALVILVIFVFLQSWRSTIIPAVTIPVSLIGTFIFVKLFGFSINTLTLFGLTLATGLVVDDAIVVIENIERHMTEKQQPARTAASSAMAEVASAVIATSLVLVAVFVPVALFPGTTGRLYKQFSLTIAFSIALSAFNALTLTPALSAILLKHTGATPGRIFAWVNRGIDALTTAFHSTLTRTLRHKVIAIAVFIGCLVVTGFLYKEVPNGFVPDEDQGYLIVIVQAPAGGSLQNTLETTKKIEKMALAQPEMEGVFNVSGFSFSGTAANKAVMFFPLKPMEDRRGADHSAEAVLARLRPLLSTIDEAIVIPFLPPPIQGVGNTGGFAFEIEDRAGSTIEALARATSETSTAGNQMPELRGVFSQFTANDPQLVVEIEREKAKSLSIPLDQISAALQVYMGSAYVNDFDFNNRSYRVYAQADAPFRTDPTALEQYYVRSTTGQMVPLASVIHVVSSTAPQTISHYNMFRATEINGSPAPGVSSGQALAAMEMAAKKTLPEGMTYEWSGLQLEQIESGGKTFIIFGLGVLFVYLVLAAQYESFALPLIILFAVPLALLGAMLFVWLRGLQNDVFCQIGLVMLVGLASKNAILIVEFAEQLRADAEHPRTIAEAAVEAARLRLRPILMTSLAFVLGVLPLVFASGAGANSRHSLGTAVCGGMALSTVFNLYFIPVLYVIVETLREKKHAPHTAEAPHA
ncbi:MAG: multidrug efflux RND transporter permease subunit [Polyangia bacterium]